MAGAFDGFENTHRSQFFYREDTEDTIFLEKIVKHAANYQQQLNSSQASLFGDMEEIEIKDPEMPQCDPWTKLEQLKNEKEVTGFYMSGHPLEDYKIEIDNFCNITINEIKNNLNTFYLIIGLGITVLIIITIQIIATITHLPIGYLAYPGKFLVIKKSNKAQMQLTQTEEGESE